MINYYFVKIKNNYSIKYDFFIIYEEEKEHRLQ